LWPLALWFRQISINPEFVGSVHLYLAGLSKYEGSSQAASPLRDANGIWFGAAILPAQQTAVPL
jgi:hypothetical protein